MEDIAALCSWADTQLLEDSQLVLHIPPELRTQILDSTGSDYLNALAFAAQLPQCTDRLFSLYEPVFVDLVNRWIEKPASTILDALPTLSSLARLVPFAPHFKSVLVEMLSSSVITYSLSTSKSSTVADVNHDDLRTLLLSLFRILSYDRDLFGNLLAPAFFSLLLNHESLCIRYLSVECLCMVMHFADAFSEDLVQKYVGEQAILGTWEGKHINYRLLKLWEEQRWKTLEGMVERLRTGRSRSALARSKALSLSDLHQRTAVVGRILLPRTRTASETLGTFVLGPNARANLSKVGSALLDPKPLLIAGPASSGKTSLIFEAARILNKAESMVTLHLNEQTDAKSLIGLHASSPIDHTFVWQPGVLTRALQEGRWVLIEDIDRAPAEVLGVLRPIIEHGDVFIPSRKQRIQAHDGFRVLATMRVSSSGSAKLPARSTWLANPRLWNHLQVNDYAMAEISHLIQHRYPATQVLLDAILDLHTKVCELFNTDSAFRTAQSRTPSLRDLLKWCRRISKRVESEDLRQAQAVPEVFKTEIFKDAIDCYASHLSDDFLYNKVAASLARSMNMPPQQMQHYLTGSLQPVQDAAQSISIGRTTLPKYASRRSRVPNTPFADTQVSRRCLESFCASVAFAEPYLLVGETGVGKTSLIQHVAGLVGQDLTVINLSQQSEATELLGGLKPVTTRSMILPLIEPFNVLFDDTFSAKKNERFRDALSKALTRQNWSRLLKLWLEAISMADKALQTSRNSSVGSESIHTSKRRRLATPRYEELQNRWNQFADAVNRVRPHAEHGEKSHSFSFVEGRLVRAVRDGGWVLLDEINLASSDTLDHIVSLLQDSGSDPASILLTEAGSVQKITTHPNFRIFAAMNPATDMGKKDLAPGIRSRFTELFVHSGDKDLDDLVKIIQSYLGRILENDKRAAPALGNAYLDVQKLSLEHKLTDGAGDLPHFSIRSLVRCLLYTLQHSASHGLRRAMFEGFIMSFFTVLSRESEALALPFVSDHLLSDVKNLKSFLAQQPKVKADGKGFVKFRHHLIRKGSNPPDFQPHYIRTPSVERNLINLARAASMHRFPILLQGPTSAGKTSMVEYLAKLSGNKFLRINNHENTDLQEYLGSYSSDNEGKLKFTDGVLVDALRQGHWLVLDELNLAPTDVLEALNRLLDDNRELMVPETQEIIRPHPNFMLFATQNPAGLYGGRKRMSRAFRNRFLEIHLDEIPEDELEIILRERAQIAPSFCTQIVAVYKKLSLQRQSSRLFDQKNSFATLRDLFRWASRPVSDRQELANHGFMLLAERVRDPGERQIVKTTIEETMKLTINENSLYGASVLSLEAMAIEGIIWTGAMRRLFVLVSSALRNDEPVLLIGETGCGKTQICQVIAAAFGRPLNIYNAHTNTETGDLIGSQRPLRSRSQVAADVVSNFQSLIADDVNVDVKSLNLEQIIDRFNQLDTTLLEPEVVARTRSSITAYQSLFEWSDGSLVRSMRQGEHFLLDEISLADDSVLERLNSLLEPARTVLLAEKGAIDNVVVAHPSFQFLSTMNPGGDYGKRELSAALRNRLTEIWVPPLSREQDVLPILTAKLKPEHSDLASLMLTFSSWFKETFHGNVTATIALRDLLAWVVFVNSVRHLTTEEAFLHGAAMVYIDSIGANPAGMTALNSNVQLSRLQCVEFLQTLVSISVSKFYHAVPTFHSNTTMVQLGPFTLLKTRLGQSAESELVFEAPTTLKNAMRLIRALQMDRPILLEGSPGVGKTAIVTALAQILGKHFIRINLSDQTDLMDLFGSDTPAENETLGRFVWKDGPLLEAMQNGGWVLLDEMNLASQAVLEGLNSCFDHRKEVYIAELDKTFTCHPEFALFAAQNPHHQGSGRKGLPASFVNRFTVVYSDPLQKDDLLCICHARYQHCPTTALHIETVVHAVSTTNDLVSRDAAFNQGGPWEVNLRDVSRWLQLCSMHPHVASSLHYPTVIEHRFRNPSQQSQLQKIGTTIFTDRIQESYYPRLTATSLQVGLSSLRRDRWQQFLNSSPPIVTNQLPQAKSIITAISQAWPVILGGPSGAGKTKLIRSLAAASGTKLLEISMNAEIDTMDLLGGFEQYDEHCEIEGIKSRLRKASVEHIEQALPTTDSNSTLALMELYQASIAPGTDARSLLSALRALPEKWSMNALESQLKSVIMQSQQPGSRFVWNDGILVDAIREGVWLVLDNANLCNASVLDRLNSLLEPGGHIVLSEQHNADDGARTIKPHANFRVFLTMDPNYGELSRAIRNRSLEVFLAAENESQSISKSVQYPWTAGISRLRPLFNDVDNEDVLYCFLDNLAQKDVKIAQCQPLQEPGIRDGSIAFVKAAISNRFDSHAGKLWSQIQEYSYTVAGKPERDGDGFLSSPLQLFLNEPLFLNENMTSSTPEVAELFRLWQVAQKLSEIWSRLETARMVVSSSQTGSMTVFEKSYRASLDLKRKQSSMPPFFTFTEKVFHLLSDSAIQALGMRSHLFQSKSLMAVAEYTNDVVQFADGTDLDMATLQALLSLGHGLARKLLGAHEQLGAGLQGFLGLFEVNQFESGLGLQRMWRSWKPRTPSTLEQLKIKLALEQMIDRFDETVSRLLQSRSAFMTIKTKLLDILGCIWKQENASLMLQALGQPMESLEIQAERRRQVPTYFKAVFDSFLRRTTVLNKTLRDSSLQLISMFSEGSDLRSFRIWEDGKVQEALRKLVLAQKDQETHAQDLGSLIVSKTAQLSVQSLRSLGRIQEEVLAMTKLLSSNPSTFTEDIMPAIRGCICVLLSNIMLSHKDLLSAQAEACITTTGEFDFACLVQMKAIEVLQIANSETGYFHEIYRDHIHPAVELQESGSAMSLGKALVHTCLAALILLVPNRPFDPAVYESLRQAQYNAKRHALQVKIDSQRTFNQRLMGQDSSLVLRLLVEDLTRLGDQPFASPIFRPKLSQLPKVQEELSNVLRTVVHDLPKALLQSDGELQHIVVEARRLNQNISRLLDRLENLDRAYDDLVVPVSQLLQALGLGASLMASRGHREQLARTGHQIITHIPMLGAQPGMIIEWSVESSLGHTKDSIFWLKHHAICRNLQLLSRVPREQRSQVEHLQIIDRVFQQWKTQLTRDQIEAQEKSRYYSYRGGERDDEDMERELAGMFPSYEKEEEPSAIESSAEYNGRAMAVQIASLHEKVFELKDSNTNIHSLLLDALQLHASGSHQLQGAETLKDHFPGVLLQMESEMQSLNGENALTTINIYTNCSITEVHKVFNLVQSLQARFYEISDRWPEHAVPTEVIAFSEELLDFKISSPLAKLLTKTQKLLEMVAQWQSVASREWSVTSLVDELTTLVVSWRRVELASWSRLLDLEKQRSDEDARAWYFIAYEAVIYNSRRVVETEGDVSGYSQELARTVEEFLRSTTVGQFVPRLRLLEVLQKSLHENAELDPRLVTISKCVASIIAHYQRYVPTIEKTLQSRRSELEKAVVEQIKLASWKDTNVTALKDSAKRSHQKLFTIVRKYRALLGNPVSVLTSEGITNNETAQLKQLSVLTDEPESLQRALSNCVNQISDWSERPERLRNPLQATSSMRFVYNSRIPDFDASAELATFRDDLTSSVKTLRKETPHTLTDDNASLVRHLRERKRRLFTDTVKSVTLMGPRRNLGTGELEKQANISMVLSNSSDLISNDDTAFVALANSAFHEFIDGMPTVRAALAEHSPDLTDGEVRRSAGLLEGMLFLIIRQRDGLANSVKEIRSLRDALSPLQALTATTEAISLDLSRSASSKLSQRLAWLPTIIDVGCQVLSYQVKHGQLPLQSLLDDLRRLSESLTVQAMKLASSPLLPQGLVCAGKLQIRNETQSILSELRVTLEEWQANEPNIEYITRQLLPWTEIPDNTLEQMTNGTIHYSVTDLDQSATTVAGAVFVALQQLTSVETQPVMDTKEAGWLVRNDKSFIECWSALHIPRVAEELQSLLESLHHVHGEDLSLTVSLVNVIAPILEQFYMICQHIFERQMVVHLEAIRLGTYLAKAFSSLATEGFCSPAEQSGEKDQEGKLESGTGLGDGEGAEDVSKDVGDDEDLSEFAKDGQKEDEQGSIEGAEDAVDMGIQELNGEDGEAADREENEGSDEADGVEMDEETGSVDDLDPTAVDEKMWDDANKQAENENEKDLKGEKGKEEKVDDQTAAEEGMSEQTEKRDGDVEGQEMNDEETGAEDEIDAMKAEGEHTDPHLQEEKALDLPEDMQLTGEEQGKEDELSDGAMDELSDVGEPEEVDEVGEPDREEHGSGDDTGDESNPEGETNAEGKGEDTEVDDQPIEDGWDEEEYAEKEGEMQFDEDVDAEGRSGAANQLQDNIDPNQKSEGRNQTNQIEDERQQPGGKAAENDQDGKMGRGSLEQGQGRQTATERQPMEALKKLSDVLDQWHQPREIFDPSEDHEQKRSDQDIDMTGADFEHVEDEDEGDAQALGAARADQVQSLDQSRAIQEQDLSIEDDTAMPDVQEFEEQEKIAERLTRLQAQATGERREDGSFVPDAQQQQRQPSPDPTSDIDADMINDTTSEVDRLHLDPACNSPPISSTTAAQLWNHSSHLMHQSALILTEQLRLILSPTTATKLRGDFRSGKRLNIKRIIPYIASGYKRDKIWMRRSVPSKRNYQIMIAVDDSKSMAEGGADVMALQSLTLLCKSLSMLEVGDVSVMAFGQDVKISHSFGETWKGDESGIEVFGGFGFEQTTTDVKKLLERGLGELREARLKAPSGSGEETWQLFLIMSDGHCGDHERVRRLVREGKDERVLCVFIILDGLNTTATITANVSQPTDGEASGRPAPSTSTPQPPESAMASFPMNRSSILDLKEAFFEPDPNHEGEMRVVTRRYLERFPFEYYLVVRDVRDLPGVLARCLRGWFGGVVDV